MSAAEEPRNGAPVNGRYDVPLTSAGPDGQPARRNGRRRTTTPERSRPADPTAMDEPDTAATDEPVAGPNGRTRQSEPVAADEPVTGANGRARAPEQVTAHD
ncbi:MAG: hypothetical protein WA890_24705, partial [Micromonospora sp.]